MSSVTKKICSINRKDTEMDNNDFENPYRNIKNNIADCDNYLNEIIRNVEYLPNYRRNDDENLNQLLSNLEFELKNSCTDLADILQYTWNVRAYDLHKLLEIRGCIEPIFHDLSYLINNKDIAYSKNIINLCYKIISNCHHLNQIVIPLRNLYLNDSPKHSIILNQLSNASSEANSYLDNIKEVNDNFLEIKNILSLSQQATFFSDEANNHKMASYFWLGLSAFLLILMIIVTYNYIYLFDISELTNKENFKNNLLSILLITLSSRFIILSILGFALFYCTKYANIHNHNAIINQHRSNAINTFRSFAENIKDDKELQNIMLFQATNCIFSFRNTGYNIEEPNSLNSYESKIIELFTSLIKKG